MFFNKLKIVAETYVNINKFIKLFINNNLSHSLINNEQSIMNTKFNIDMKHKEILDKDIMNMRKKIQNNYDNTLLNEISSSSSAAFRRGSPRTSSSKPFTPMNYFKKQNEINEDDMIKQISSLSIKPQPSQAMVVQSKYKYQLDMPAQKLSPTKSARMEVGGKKIRRKHVKKGKK